VGRGAKKPAPWSAKKAAARILAPDENWSMELRERVLADTHPAQYDAVTDPATRISMLVGRGGTKTTTMRVRGVLMITSTINADVRYIANSRSQAEELMWGPLKRLAEAYGIYDEFDFLDGKLRATCKRTGGVYQLFGVEERRDADKMRGFPPNEVQLDEVGSMDPRLLEYLLEECIAPRIGERGGAIVIGSTPPSRLAGPFYDATRLGAVDADGIPLHRPYKDRERPEWKDWIRWSSHAWDLESIVGLPDAAKRYPALVANWNEALINKRRKGWSDDHPIWLREWKGLWASDHTDRVFRYRPHVDGQSWNQWDPFGDRKLEGIDALKAAVAALPKDVGMYHFVVAMDSGSRDPFACNAFAFAPKDPRRRVIHVFAFERTGMYARTEAELLIGPDPEQHPGRPQGGIFGVIGWPDAVVFDADGTHLDELRNVYGIGAKKAERKADYKFGAIELTNGDFVDGRIWILKGSPLEQQLELLQWKPDDYGMLREDKAQANHSTDTLIAGRLEIASLFQSGIVSAEGETETARPDAYIPGQKREPQGDDLESLLIVPDFDEDDEY
jgi:hypothetical protein